MSDLAQTPANVLASASASPARRSIAGATITQGMPIYHDATDGDQAKPAVATSAAAAAVSGFALSAAAEGQPLTWIESDPQWTPGATVVQGTIYVLSDTAGGIMPAADLAATDQVTILGVGLAGNKIHARPVVSGTTGPSS